MLHKKLTVSLKFWTSEDCSLVVAIEYTILLSIKEISTEMIHRSVLYLMIGYMTIDEISCMVKDVYESLSYGVFVLYPLM